MKSVSTIVVLISLLFQPVAKSQEGWVLKKDKKGIKIYSRKVNGFKVDEIKVETEYEGRVSQLAAIILDVNAQPDWVYKTVRSELVKRVSTAELIYYTEISCPWPFENRDLVAHMTVGQNTVSRVMTIVAKSVNDYVPQKEDIVRLKYSNATWIVTPINNGHIKVEYRIIIDPGDGVPAWLLNMFTTSGPYESFINLREKMKHPKYAQARLPFIID